MPEVTSASYSINGHALSLESQWDLGEINYNQEEIIAFAKVIDPLPIHTDPEAGAKSPFGTLIAPGTMMYSTYHANAFIPRFGPSIIAGQRIEDWAFYQPHFPDQTYTCQLTVLDFKPRPDKGLISVLWHFQMFDLEANLVQEVKPRILHRLDA